MYSSVLLLLCTIVVAVTLRVFRRGKAGSLPPGPPGLPILGNLLQFSSMPVFMKLSEWAKEFGPIYSYNLLGQPLIVLSSAKVAGDILDRMSSLTSDRPRLIKVNEYMCRNTQFAALSRNPTWRRLRRAAHENLNVQAAPAFEQMQQEEALIFAEGLLSHPEVDFLEHANRMSSSIAWRAIFGHETIPLEGPNTSAQLDDVIKEIFLSSVPGGSVVDLLPFLNPIIARSKLLRSQADQFYERATAFFTKAFSDDQVEGTVSVSSKLKEKGDKLGMTSAHDCGWVGAVLFMAAQDTTATAIRWLVLAILLYPETIVAAQQELTNVVGDRPPTFEDRGKLPYVEAVMKEVLRWRVPAPLAIAHRASEAFTYGGFLIPKDAWIVPNLWSMCRDPALYPDGEVFNPARFIDENGHIKKPLPDSHDDYICFGHGRRICVGKTVAINSLWISIATILWAFDCKKGRDAQGEEITPDAWAFIDNGVTVWPKTFPLLVVPRIPDLAERLRASKMEKDGVA